MVLQTNKLCVCESQNCKFKLRIFWRWKDEIKSSLFSFFLNLHSSKHFHHWIDVQVRVRLYRSIEFASFFLLAAIQFFKFSKFKNWEDAFKSPKKIERFWIKMQKKNDERIPNKSNATRICLIRYLNRQHNSRSNQTRIIQVK